MKVDEPESILVSFIDTFVQKRFFVKDINKIKRIHTKNIRTFRKFITVNIIKYRALILKHHEILSIECLLFKKSEIDIDYVSVILIEL